jgi:hypothetical protein
MLFRYSDASYNEMFLREGVTFISPASSHDHSGASNAVRDDELRLRWRSDAGTEQVAKVSDYHCLCMSSEYDHRLFFDFDSDSCVAIKNPLEFSRRLRVAIQRHRIRNNAPRISALRECPVIYVDPLRMVVPETATEVYFSKHFRFAYQTEFRFVLSTLDRGPLEPLILELGTLTDIAEIVTAPRP